jgi:hypothetical protein
MASEFTLTQNENFNWQGPTGKKAKIKVVPVASTIAIKIANAFYPGTTAVTADGDTVEIILTSGPADISLSIQPRVVPQIVWSVVEVGTSGGQQTLATVNDPDPQMDPYSTGVRVIGQGSGL